MLEKALKGVAYECVVIGGGLRIRPKSLALFEMVVNAVHKAAPGATIAFNTRPEDTAEAANSMPANGVQNATTRSAYAVPWLLSAASAWHLKMRMMHSGLEKQKHNLCYWSWHFVNV
jgi:hypothetical protein